MYQNFQKAVIALSLATTLFMTSCSDDSNDPETVTVAENYVVMSGESTNPFSGYITSFGGTLPSGQISNIKTSSKQVLGSLGMRSIGKYFYKMANFQYETGVQKFSVSATGEIKDEGFIACGKAILGSAQYTVVNETTGFYFDGDRGLLKIQKFNPSTMQRTGEIDLSTQLANSAIEYISVGQNCLMVKEGKLFANVHYGKSASKGFLDAVDDKIRFAVIDIATGTFEKVTTFTTGTPQQVCWFTDNSMWDLGDDGALYFCTLGKVAGGASKILRFKAGATDIDTTWKLEMDDYKLNGCFVNVIAKGGKIYTRIPTESLKSDFSNLYGDIWSPTIIDINTKVATTISGIPVCEFKGNEEAMVEVDGKIHFLISNTSLGTNGVYKVEGTTGTQLFNLTQGGRIVGFGKSK